MQQALTLSQAEVEAELCKRSFEEFMKRAWPIIEPGTPLLWNWHISALALHLQAVHEGHIKKLLINIAPGHAKSSIVSVLYPVWCWLNDPHGRWLCASHSQDLSLRDNKNRRDLIESEWFQERFGNIFKLSSTQNVKSYFENNKRGYFTSVSVMSSCTGKRASNLLIDDANNAMAGEADVLAVKDWHGKTWTSRLNDQENGSMIVVGQRLHEQDLSGHLLSLGGWTHLNLPEEFEEARRCTTYLKKKEPTAIEPITVEVRSFTSPRKKYKVVFASGKASNCTCEARFFNPEEPCKHMKKAVMPPSASDQPFWTDPRTVEGQLLWPEKFPVEVLDSLKKSLGSFDYAAQYQQSPVPASGGTFQESWKRYFEIEGDYYILHTKYGTRKPVPIRACKVEAVCDLAVSEREQSDFFVIETWAITPENEVLLLDQLRGHFNNPDQQKKAIELYERFRWMTFWVENVAYQLAYIQQMKHYEVKEEVAPGLYRVVKTVSIPVRPWKPFRDKVARAGVAAVKQEAGDLYWLMRAAYLTELEPEIFKFPRSKKKDQVDCHSMICDILSNPQIPMQDAIYTPVPVAASSPSSVVPIDLIAAQQRDPFAYADKYLGGGW